MVQSVLTEGAAVPGHSSTKLTYADYVQFPDDGLRHEIIEGEHYVTPAPTTRHQRISGNLFYFVRCYLEIHPIGEVFAAPFDVLLSEFNILEPDLVYLSTERSHFLTSKNLQGAPDLVVEILSPSTKSRDLDLKRDVYERTGVDEYWIVDADRNVVDVYRRHDSTSAPGQTFSTPIRYERAQILNTPLLPGLELPLDKILA
jgi:Uma2 family endonuclease